VGQSVQPVRAGPARAQHRASLLRGARDHRPTRLACSGRPHPPAPIPPRPTPVLPTAIPSPSQNAAAQFAEDPDEVEAAFHDEVEQLIAQVQFLTNAPCDRLSGALAQDPSRVPQLKAFAATLKRLAPKDQALDRQGTPFLLKRLDDALGELDQKLADCRASMPR
jgi:hypothetical protein